MCADCPTAAFPACVPLASCGFIAVAALPNCCPYFRCVMALADRRRCAFFAGGSSSELSSISMTVVGGGLVPLAGGSELVLGALAAFEMVASLVALVMGDTLVPLAAVGNRDWAGGGVGWRGAGWGAGARTADGRAAGGGATTGTATLFSAEGIAGSDAVAGRVPLSAGVGDGRWCGKVVDGRSGVARRGPNIWARVGLSIAVAFAAVMDGETGLGEASVGRAALERARAGLPGGGGGVARCVAIR